MKRHCVLSLHLFDGEGGGPAAGAAAAQPAGTNSNPALGTQGQGAQPVTKVVYGKQPNADPVADDNGQVAADNKATEPKADPKDGKASFEELISGEYKDEFSERVQQIINKRFKDTKRLEDFQGGVTPILEILAQKYGVDASDVKALSNALNNDDSYWEQLADAQGLTVEQYKQLQSIENENKRFKRMLEAQQQENAAQQIYTQWVEDAKTVQADYPDFNLDAECKNKDFVDLLSSGVGMKTAYEVVHINDVKAKVAQKVQSAVVNNVRSQGNRPDENGTNTQTGVLFKTDASKLTKEDRAEIARRAQRGEVITF